MIVTPSLINLDFADVKTTMKDKGLAHMGLGKGHGENRTIEAVRQAVSSPLLETTIEGATGIILNIKGGLDLTLDEVYASADLVKEVVDPSCNIIFGSGIDERMNDEVEITIIATGFNQAPAEVAERSAVNSNFVESEVDEDEEDDEEEVNEEPATSVVHLDNAYIPPFLQKLKNKK